MLPSLIITSSFCENLFVVNATMFLGDPVKLLLSLWSFFNFDYSWLNLRSEGSRSSSTLQLLQSLSGEWLCFLADS